MIIQRPAQDIRKKFWLVVVVEILAALAGLLGGWIRRELRGLDDSVELEGRNFKAVTSIEKDDISRIIRVIWAVRTNVNSKGVMNSHG